jgi:hypothetical protein
LKVHPAQRTALSVKRNTALEQIRVQVTSVELAAAEGARKGARSSSISSGSMRIAPLSAVTVNFTA